MLVRRQLLKVKKQFADQTFLRGEKLDNQSDLDIAQKRVDAIKHSCQTLQKKINACLQGSGQDASAMEKRKKKMPAFSLAHSMQEGGSMCEDGSILGVVLRNCSEIQNRLAEELLNFENQVENNVLSPLNVLLETDIPNIVKMKKQLNKLIQDMESAKAKFEAAVKHSSQTTGSATGAALTKAELFKEEYEELSMKVEQQRDMLAAEMFSLLSREAEIARIFVQWYQLQADYNSNVSSILEMGIPQMSNIIDNHTHRPVYGCPLTEHLRVTNRTISLVVEKCISALLVYGLNEEGLFRIGGSASKLKKLKNSFDAGIINMTEYITDPHSIAGALKSYLRELPEPLLTHTLYDEWMNANTITDHDLRLQTFWQIVYKLPEANVNNLKYIIKFLAKLTNNSDVNKMSTQNLAIVMAPNLIWPPQADQSNHIGMNMTVANIHSSIVDSLVTYADYFFPGEVDFTISPLPLPNDHISDVYMGIVNSGFVASNGEVESESVSGNFNTSPTSQSPRIIHRPGKKPAPPAPGAIQQMDMKQGKNNYGKSHSSPEEYTSVPLRSKSRERSRGPSLERTRSIQESEYSATLHANRLTLAGEKFNPSLSRSATLDRPGKPKRNSLTQRPSHDNLANFIKADQVVDNDEKPVPMVRNSSLERSRIIDKPPIHAKSMANISQIDSHGNMLIQKPILIEKGSGNKPEVPAKPPSLDNIVGSFHNSGPKTIDIDDIDVKFNEQGSSSRRSSDKDSIHFADESDNEDVFKMDSSIHSVTTPMSSSLDSSKDEIDRSNQSPSQLQNVNASSPPTTAVNVDPAMNSFSAKMEKKWMFLTSPALNGPPERPPRNFTLPGSQMKEEYISAPVPGSFVHVSSHMTQSTENILGSSNLSVSKMTASTLSLPGNIKGSAENQTATVSDTSSSNPLLDDTSKEKGHETETRLLPIEISNTNAPSTNVSVALPQNGKVPPSPTSTLKRPPRPQPPPPPTKPKLNNHSEDTRL